MPCLDYRSDDDMDNAKHHLDRYAAMLCAACKLMKPKQIDKVKGLSGWWEQHQIDDAIAADEARSERVRKKKIEKALSKLNQDDFAALGIDKHDFL